jgi:hypothetical protein
MELINTNKIGQGKYIFEFTHFKGMLLVPDILPIRSINEICTDVDNNREDIKRLRCLAIEVIENKIGYSLAELLFMAEYINEASEALASIKYIKTGS